MSSVDHFSSTIVTVAASFFMSDPLIETSVFFLYKTTIYHDFVTFFFIVYLADSAPGVPSTAWFSIKVQTGNQSCGPLDVLIGRGKKVTVN